MYEPENQQPSLLKEFLTSPISPSTYTFMYTSMPGTYNLSKGLRVPFIGKALEKGGWKAVGQGIKNVAVSSYTGRNPVTGTLKLGTNVGGRLASFGFKGGGYVGGNWMEMGKQVKEFQEDLRVKARASLRSKAINRSEIWKHADDIARESLDDLSKGNRAANYTRSVTRYSKLLEYKDIKNYKNVAKLVKTKGAGKLATAAATRNLAKTALLGGKIVGWAGLAQMGYQLATAIGRPIGSAAMTAIDNTMTEYQNRFMPETGGELTLAYITQGAATERQRAIESISKAQINGRRAIGQEAANMHS